MKIAMLLSGGVDSSVAMARLVAEGRHEVVAFYLKIWLEDELAYLGSCPWEEDTAFCAAVCDSLGVRFEVVPFQREYWDRVVSYTLSELKAGRTPSPDVLCNRRVKFGAFLDTVGQDFDAVASGHYAMLRRDAKGTHLLRAKDPVKDQTYFLNAMTQEQLARCLFPLGPFLKSEVREQAEALALPNMARKDSQGICFLGKISFREFVKANLGEREGSIVVRESGKKIGKHKGYWFHTIGQRKGLDLPGGPWFVVGKDIDANIVWVSHADDNAVIGKCEFEVAALNWLTLSPQSGETLDVKLRHGPRVISCRVTFDAPERMQVSLNEADNGIASGQFAVFYRGEECLGGGIIC